MSVNHVEFKSKRANPQLNGVDDVTPEEVQSLVNQVAVIDVRRPDEWIGELGHIPQAALITLDTLPGRMDEIPKDKTVVFVCRSGARSAQAAAFAKGQGIDNVYNMQGGMLAWNEMGFEVTREE